ncbi:hypothetical protein Fmac_005423 [Flemingia macrophylla]|uniref:C2H2-type domain-containing protein n=1 Tax=Flemingia macrophylla TaxID=520843 RepID=A0ABD1N839_9FABA
MEDDLLMHDDVADTTTKASSTSTSPSPSHLPESAVVAGAGADGPPSSDDQKYECQYCYRELANLQALDGHQNAHKKERQQLKRAQLQASQNATVSFVRNPMISAFPPPPPLLASPGYMVVPTTPPSWVYVLPYAAPPPFHGGKCSVRGPKQHHQVPCPRHEKQIPGFFKSELIEPVFKLMLEFLRQTDSHLLNAYPMLAYAANADKISLDYALLRDNPDVVALEYDNILVTVFDTGWPPPETLTRSEQSPRMQRELGEVCFELEWDPFKANTSLNVFLIAT